MYNHNENTIDLQSSNVWNNADSVNLNDSASHVAHEASAINRLEIFSICISQVVVYFLVFIHVFYTCAMTK